MVGGSVVVAVGGFVVVVVGFPVVDVVDDGPGRPPTAGAGSSVVVVVGPEVGAVDGFVLFDADALAVEAGVAVEGTPDASVVGAAAWSAVPAVEVEVETRAACLATSDFEAEPHPASTSVRTTGMNFFTPVDRLWAGVP